MYKHGHMGRNKGMIQNSGGIGLVPIHSNALIVSTTKGKCILELIINKNHYA